MSIGERIKQKRIELGLTQLELAERMGYKSKAAICKVERGEDNITSDRVVRFANALGVSISYIMGWDDEPIAFDIEEENKDDRLGKIVEAYMNKELLDKYNEMPQEYKNIVNNSINTVYEAWKSTL